MKLENQLIDSNIASVKVINAVDHDFEKLRSERDSALELANKFEIQLTDMRINIEILTKERDSLAEQLKQTQHELLHQYTQRNHLSPSRPLSSVTTRNLPFSVRRFEAERNQLAESLRKMTLERDSLRQRIRVINKDRLTEKAHLQQALEDLKRKLESCRQELQVASNTRPDHVKQNYENMLETCDGVEMMPQTLNKLNSPGESSDTCALKSQLNHVQEENTRLRRDLVNLQHHVENSKLEQKLRVELNERTECCSKLQRELDDMKILVQNLEENLQNKTEKFECLQMEHDKAIRKLDILTDATKKTYLKSKHLQSEYRNSKLINRKLVEQNNTLNSRLRDTQNQYNDLQLRFDRFTAHMTKKNEQIKLKHERNMVLESRLSEYAKTIEKLMSDQAESLTKEKRVKEASDYFGNSYNQDAESLDRNGPIVPMGSSVKQLTKPCEQETDRDCWDSPKRLPITNVTYGQGDIEPDYSSSNHREDKTEAPNVSILVDLVSTIPKTCSRGSRNQLNHQERAQLSWSSGLDAVDFDTISCPKSTTTTAQYNKSGYSGTHSEVSHRMTVGDDSPASDYNTRQLMHGMSSPINETESCPQMFRCLHGCLHSFKCQLEIPLASRDPMMRESSISHRCQHACIHSEQCGYKVSGVDQSESITHHTLANNSSECCSATADCEHFAPSAHITLTETTNESSATCCCASSCYATSHIYQSTEEQTAVSSSSYFDDLE